MADFSPAYAVAPVLPPVVTAPVLPPVVQKPVAAVPSPPVVVTNPNPKPVIAPAYGVAPKIPPVVAPKPPQAPQQAATASPDEQFVQALKAYDAVPTPQYTSPTYKPENKWLEYGSLLATLLFGGSPFGSFASGVARGLPEGAEKKYEREQQEAAAKYQAEVNTQAAAEKHAQTLGTIADAQDKIAEKNAVDQAKADYNSARLLQYQQQIGLNFAKFGFDKQYKLATLNEKTWYQAHAIQNAAQRNAITAEDAQRGDSTRLQVAAIVQAGEDARLSKNLVVREAAPKAKHLEDGYNAALRQAVKVSGTDPQAAQAIMSAATATYNQGVSSLYAQVASTAPELAQVQNATDATIPDAPQIPGYDQQELPDGTQETQGYATPGGYPSWYNQPAGQQPAGQQQTVTQTQAAPVQHPLPQALGANPQAAFDQALAHYQAAGMNPNDAKAAAIASVEKLVPHGASGSWGSNAAPPASPAPVPFSGPGVEEATFAQARAATSTTADQFPTEQAFLAHLQSIPGAQALSHEQTNELLETWAKTRSTHGHPTQAKLLPAAQQSTAQQPSPAQQYWALAASPNAQNALVHQKAQAYIAQGFDPEVAALHAKQDVQRELAADRATYGDPGPNPIQRLESWFQHDVLAQNPGESLAAAQIERGPGSALDKRYELERMGVNPNVALHAAPDQRPERLAENTPTPHPQTLPSHFAPSMGQVVQHAAQENNVPEQLIAAVIQAESGGNQQARSRTGAIGPMQLEPATAHALGVNPDDPIQNILGGTKYLASLLKQFRSIPLALAAYNAGPGAVAKYRGIPPFAETRAYVARVMTMYLRMMKAQSQNHAPQRVGPSITPPAGL